MVSILFYLQMSDTLQRQYRDGAIVNLSECPFSRISSCTSLRVLVRPCGLMPLFPRALGYCPAKYSLGQPRGILELSRGRRCQSGILSRVRGLSQYQPDSEPLALNPKLLDCPVIDRATSRQLQLCLSLESVQRTTGHRSVDAIHRAWAESLGLECLLDQRDF
jgi:hypothetical protein